MVYNHAVVVEQNSWQVRKNELISGGERERMRDQFSQFLKWKGRRERKGEEIGKEGTGEQGEEGEQALANLRILVSKIKSQNGELREGMPQGIVNWGKVCAILAPSSKEHQYHASVSVLGRIEEILEL